VAGRFSKRRKRYIREEDNKSNKQVMASSEWFYVLISRYITGMDRGSVRGKTVFALMHPFNARYAVEFHVFALILAVCRARIITNPTIRTSSY
jgi:hypothetical protein